MTAKDKIDEEKYEAMKKLIKADNSRWEEIFEKASKSAKWCEDNGKPIGKAVQAVLFHYAQRKEEILASKTIELPYGTLREWEPRPGYVHDKSLDHKREGV